MSPEQLAELIAGGAPVTVLDVRPDADWHVEGPGVNFVHVPAAAAIDGARALAGRLPGRVAVVCERGRTARGVAAALRDAGVDATVLEHGMRGWIGTLRAYPVDLGLPGVRIVQVQRPGRGCLSYLIAVGDEALVVDPAPDASFYVDLAAGMDARITQVFDTHVHADHLSGARALADLTGAVLRLPAASLDRGVAYADRLVPVTDGEVIVAGPPAIRALALPGHTTDMTGLLIGDRALVAGDSLFADGIARPDLQRGDREGALEMARVLHNTLRERILRRSGDLTLLPCHTHPGVRPAAIAPSLDEVRAAVPELSIDDPDRFATLLTAAMPPRPANYESIIAVNSGLADFDADLEGGGNSCAAR
ncbi:MAG TPA: MBL fold metallo-hydrolase [Solirubrobacterales bacterium]|nr:MBL fold metallo-hydrolase [Solirubrobacterales bacterium]